jgi:glucan phosphoethanolaminetransferase (alkaline phosphatase superfamily)
LNSRSNWHHRFLSERYKIFLTIGNETKCSLTEDFMSLYYTNISCFYQFWKLIFLYRDVFMRYFFSRFCNALFNRLIDILQYFIGLFFTCLLLKSWKVNRLKVIGFFRILQAASETNHFLRKLNIRTRTLVCLAHLTPCLFLSG